MTPRIGWREATLTIVALLLTVAAVACAAQAGETPRRGGTLLAVVGADPPSLDPHQENTGDYALQFAPPSMNH